MVWLIEHSPIQIIPEVESGVRWRLGRMCEAVSGQLMFIIPFVEKIDRVDLTTGAFSFQPQLVTTQDGVEVTIQLGVTYHVSDSRKLILHVGDNDTAEVVGVVGRGTAVQVIREHPFDSIVSRQAEIEDKIKDQINDRIEQYGLECDSAHLTECGETIGVRLFQ